MQQKFKKRIINIYKFIPVVFLGIGIIFGLVFGLTACQSVNSNSNDGKIEDNRAPASATTGSESALKSDEDPVDLALAMWDRHANENKDLKVVRNNRSYYDARIKNALEEAPVPNFLKGKKRSEAKKSRWFAVYKRDLSFLMALQLLIEDLDKNPADLLQNKYYPVVVGLREEYEELMDRFKSTYVFLLMDFVKESSVNQGTATKLLSWYKTEVMENFKKYPIVVNQMTTAFSEAQELFRTSKKYCDDFCQREYEKIKDNSGVLPYWRSMMLITEKDFNYEKERFRKQDWTKGYLASVMELKNQIIKATLNNLKKTGQDKIYEQLKKETQLEESSDANQNNNSDEARSEDIKNHKNKKNSDTAKNQMQTNTKSRSAASESDLNIHPCPEKKCQLTGNTYPEGWWSLTLDDGPHKIYTNQILDSLKRTNFSGTFYWLSQLILKMPNEVQRAGNENHKRASHSMTHANLSKLDNKGLNYEIDQALDKFTLAVGKKPTMFRCPYGACGPLGLSRIADKKMIHVFWNVDSLDWQDKDPNNICRRTIAQVEKLKKGIILFHDIHSQSAQCVDKLLTYFRDRVKKGDNLKLVTVPEAITHLNNEIEFASP